MFQAAKLFIQNGRLFLTEPTPQLFQWMTTTDVWLPSRVSRLASSRHLVSVLSTAYAEREALERLQGVEVGAPEELDRFAVV